MIDLNKFVSGDVLRASLGKKGRLEQLEDQLWPSTDISSLAHAQLRGAIREELR